jgi:hypothetical protein
VKLSTAAEVVPAFVTLADVPAAPVVTLPTVIVAADPAAPSEPLGPMPPVTLTSIWAAVLPADTSICVSVTLAVIGLAPLTVAEMLATKSPRHIR